MFWFVVGMLTGAGLLMAGFFFGRWTNRKHEAQPEPAKKRHRKPRCYVIEPKDFGEEERPE